MVKILNMQLSLCKRLTIKRALDFLVASVGLIVLMPLLLPIALVIKLSSPGGVLFPWRVVGLSGRPFLGYKFRTMVPNSDNLRAKLQASNEMTGPYFKMKNDPRVTPFGRILRRFSLDELPQLWSVLKGDMSLVGPRPTQTFEFEQLEPWQRRRVAMRPGCVCSWQVNGKTKDFNEMVILDLEYIDCWSLKQDLRIIAESLKYIFKGNNY